MAEPRIRTGGYTYKIDIRTTGKSSAYSRIAGISTAGISKHQDNLIGSFLGGVNLNTTTDTGAEVINSAVLPAALAAEHKILNHLIEIAAYLSAAPMRYRVKNKEKFARIRNKGNISQSQGNNSKSKRNLSGGDLDNRYNHSASGMEALNRRRQTGKARLRDAVRSGKKITYRKPKRIKTGEIKPAAAKISDAHIDKTKVTDSSIEGIQGIRQTISNINRARQAASTTVNAVKALKIIATGRYINENAKRTFAERICQGNTSYSRFYSTGVKLDKESTANTGTEAVKALRIASVKVRNTGVAAKRTYRVGRNVYTKVKTVVRNTSKTVKSI